MKLKPQLLPIITFVAVAALLLYWRHWLIEQQGAKALANTLPNQRAAVRVPQRPAKLPDAISVETTHYLTTTTASQDETRRVSEAVEHFHAAYRVFFAENNRLHGHTGEAAVHAVQKPSAVQGQQSQHSLGGSVLLTNGTLCLLRTRRT